MGLLNRLRGGRAPAAPAPVPVQAGRSVSVVLLGGHDDLEVVGESFYQDVLWRLCSGTVGERVRFGIVAVAGPGTRQPV